MADTQSFAILSLPQLPGTSGNPVISSLRYALQDASGNLIGYSETTKLQNWSVLGLAVQNLTMDGVDLSKQLDATLLYNSNGALVGGSIISNNGSSAELVGSFSTEWLSFSDS